MKTVEPKLYDVVPNKPVARFFYQGSHTHPVRRTVLVIEDKEDVLVGYEFREGDVVRDITEARKCVKSYRKDRIARYGDYARLRQTSSGFMHPPTESTLVRESILTMFTKGA